MMNELKTLRKQFGLTQIQASKMLNVPYRTYQYYEDSEKCVGTFKYQSMITMLNEHMRIDESHGVLPVEKIKKIVCSVLAKYDVRCCYLFGSYALGKQNEYSDVDLIIDSDITGIQYFSLIDELSDSLHKKVDLINLDSLVESKELLSEVLNFGIKIYQS